MLKGLDIENFKAFGRRTHIDFAPITLIFGENSAGKTTVLQSLNLLKQTRESREHSAPMLPRIEGGLVDLGGFQELVFDHDLSRSVKLGFVFDLGAMNRVSPWIRRTLAHAESLSLELVFSRPSEDAEVSISQLQLAVDESNDPLAVFQPEKLSEELQRRINRDFFMVRRIRRQEGRAPYRAMKCTSVSADRRLWERRYEAVKSNLPDIVKQLQAYRNEVVHIGTPDEPQEPRRREEQDREQLNSIDDALSFYSSDISLESFVARMLRGELETVIALDGFSPFPIRGTRSELLPEEVAFRRYAGRRIPESHTLDVGAIAGTGGRLLEEALDRLFPMGPFRRPPERWYIFTGTSPHDVGYKGELLPDLLFRNPELVHQANSWLERLEVGYQLEVRPVGTRSRDLFEVRLRDTRRREKVEVGLSDVGFGISQLLPFIVQSLCGKGRIISIEQPEVHVHPRLQADIGDLLAETIKDPFWHRFIIETHSEHLVLRLQALVRKGKLSPDDVSIIYVSRGEEGAHATRLRLNEEGEFLDEWPRGFFPERLRELM